MSIIKSFLVLLALAPAWLQAHQHQDSGTIVRFELTESVKKFLKANEYDVTGVNYDTMEIEALLSEAELAQIRGLKTQIKFSFPQNLVAAPDKEYKNPQQIEEFVKDIHARFPEITTLRSVGKSLEGRDIWAIKITSGSLQRDPKPVVLVNAMHHAREVMTPEITTDMIEYLVTRYGNDPKVTQWIDATEIWVLPMLNVDGNNRMWNGSSMWRKNTRNGHGVDLNRNYPYGWNSCRGSSANTSAQDYRGTAPASEPETRAMMDFVASIRPVFNISYHSYSEIVIYPYGCRPNRTPTEEAVEAIGAEIGRKLNYKPGTAWELLYNADGGDIDWMYTEHQVIPYVIEVSSMADGFHPSYQRRRNVTVERNRPGWMHLLERLEGPSVHGVDRARQWHTIRVFRAGESKAAQTYKINPDGSFFIMLKAGSYDLVFEGAGRSRRVENLDVQSKRVINL